jgi:hypothetical protein
MRHNNLPPTSQPSLQFRLPRCPTYYNFWRPHIQKNPCSTEVRPIKIFGPFPLPRSLQCYPVSLSRSYPVSPSQSYPVIPPQSYPVSPSQSYPVSPSRPACVRSFCPTFSLTQSGLPIQSRSGHYVQPFGHLWHLDPSHYSSTCLTAYLVAPLTNHSVEHLVAYSADQDSVNHSVNDRHSVASVEYLVHCPHSVATVNYLINPQLLVPSVPQQHLIPFVAASFQMMSNQ